jgi:hypothetical protein
MGFTYPIGRTVHDPKARIGDHSFGLHFFASPDSAKSQGGSYGSHRLAVLPAPQVWASVESSVQTPRCWHSGSATTLLCLDCQRIELDVLTNPDFWEDLKRPRSLPGGIRITYLLAANVIWHRSVEVPCN